MLCLKRFLDTVDFSLLIVKLLVYYSFACFVFCVVCICMGSCYKVSATGLSLLWIPRILYVLSFVDFRRRALFSI